jgi:hypothetical protein
VTNSKNACRLITNLSGMLVVPGHERRSASERLLALQQRNSPPVQVRWTMALPEGEYDDGARRSPSPILSADVVSVPGQNLSEFMSLEESYDTWRYVDEASLYSIAEDSREERMSEVASRCGENADSGGVYSVESGLGPMQSVGEVKKVDRTWSHDDDDTRFSDSDGVVGPCFDAAASARFRRRRRLLWGSFLCLLLLLLSVAVGVIVSASKQSAAQQGKSVPNTVQDHGQQQTNETDTGASVETSNDSDDNEGSSTSSGTSTPPTPHPTSSGNPALLRAYITSALSPCTDPSLLQDESSIQNLAFRQILREVIDASTVNSDGYLDIPVSIGSVSLAESFGLLMLYYSTGGKRWTRSDHWLTDSSHCDWLGVKQCGQTNDGTCEVYGLSLGEYCVLRLLRSPVCFLWWWCLTHRELASLPTCVTESNNISGDLPEEVCCLACLSSLDLSGNNLTSVPSCLTRMGLDMLDLSGNAGLSGTESGSARMRWYW